MSERRRQAASLVSLLVVTVLFVWACSSGDHEGISVTASGGTGFGSSHGGAGSALSDANAAPDADAGAELEVGGMLERAPASPVSHGGAGAASREPSLESAGASGSAASSGGASASEAPPSEMAGTTGWNDGGATGIDPSRGGSSGEDRENGGAPAVGGGEPVTEPTCDPADDHSTPDMFIPCEVSSVFYVCRNCHSNPPVKGVFTSYVTYADIKANAAQIYGVIKSGTMPWPPYTLSAWQKTTALKWLGKNGSCAIGALKGCQ
jgi:hypothetical protein